MQREYSKNRFHGKQIAKWKVNSLNSMQELLLKTKPFILSSLLHKLLRVPKDAHDNFLGVPSSLLRVKDAISCVPENPAYVIALSSKFEMLYSKIEPSCSDCLGFPERVFYTNLL